MSIEENNYEKAFHELEDRINEASKKLKEAIAQKSSPEEIEKKAQEMMILLGECNYLIREMKFTHKKLK
ncbi:MAG TPA: hypothetical protein P5048_00550 [Chlamydiales bacterium]|nr:hypothetical protein [Chlamydiales bacterium]